MLVGLQIIQKDILSVLSSIIRANNVLIDLIIGVICKILVILFTLVNLKIACNNYLFLTLQTMGASDARRDILMEHTGVIGRRRRRTKIIVDLLTHFAIQIACCTQ